MSFYSVRPYDPEYIISLILLSWFSAHSWLIPKTYDTTKATHGHDSFPSLSRDSTAHFFSYTQLLSLKMHITIHILAFPPRFSCPIPREPRTSHGVKHWTSQWIRVSAGHNPERALVFPFPSRRRVAGGLAPPCARSKWRICGSPRLAVLSADSGE